MKGKKLNDYTEETTNTQVSTIGNHIYFYTDVSISSALQLNKTIKELSTEIISNKTFDDDIYEDSDTKTSYNPIYLHINSLGGCFFSCLSIVDTIRTCKVPIYTIGEGQIASAASIILLAGKKRFMTLNSYILIHELRTSVHGTFSNLEDDYENSKILMKQMKDFYKKHSKITNSVLNTMLKKDVYLDAKTAKKYGFVEKIL